MKIKLLGFLAGLLLLTTQYSCSNEVEVIGIWKDIPVVYGVIDATQDTNYIRIERAYLPPNKSALLVAKNPDSIYFDPADIEVKMYRIAGLDTTPWITPLVRVDLATEGITRDSGIFANSPAYAYRLIGHTYGKYHLVIHNKKTNHTFEATTEGVNSNQFYMIMSPTYYPNSRPLAWVRMKGGEYQFQPYLFQVTPNNFASIYDIGVKFYYKEYQIDGSGAVVPGSMQSKVLDWKAYKSYIPESRFTLTITGEAFFNALKSNLSDLSNSSTRRCGGYVEIYIDGASQSFADYISALNANKGNVGGLYPAEPYSNITGGYGVFASSTRLLGHTYPLMQLTATTFDYLANGDLTQNLGFEYSTSPCY